MGSAEPNLQQHRTAGKEQSPSKSIKHINHMQCNTYKTYSYHLAMATKMLKAYLPGVREEQLAILASTGDLFQRFQER